MTKDDLIKLLNDDLERERYHLSFYLYAASQVTGLHREEVREFFLKQAAGEMDHVKEFQDVILELGGSPSTVWTGLESWLAAVTDPEYLLRHALAFEDEVVKNYVLRMEQAAKLEGVDGTYVSLFLEDQIIDSKTDAANIRRMLSR